ncbi:MAG: hypothetical protein HOP18_25860 [Deltaproteobacteria bacterium]|nr:hypothetical protein [Deltaproteobacteria bacterium]
MSRAARPLNMAAVSAADEAMYAKYENEPRPNALYSADGTRKKLSGTDPKQEDLRREWLALYAANGGKLEGPTPPPKPCDDPNQPCPITKTVTARIVSLTFRSDHLDSTGGKLLRPSAGDFKDATGRFLKPEWDEKRGGSADSHPISHTKARQVTVDVDVEFTVTPEGQSASFTEIKGVGSGDHANFTQSLGKTVRTERITIPGLVSKGPLPNFVTVLDESITWSVVADGKELPIGTTGSHAIYVTFDTPHGKMGSPRNNMFEEIGPDQDVTEERLEYSVTAAKETGVADEKECVDAIFLHMKYLGVNYYLGRSWLNGAANDTGIDPKPTLHHYLWRCNANTAKGECHNIAAAFVLACRIIGVKGPFEVGYMFPWPSRKDEHPAYPKRGDSVLGRYGVQYKRSHVGESHGQETIMFLDGGSQVNNFEGVARYRNALYAIGDARFDLFGSSDENSASYFASRDWDDKGGVKNVDLKKGAFQLVFLGESGGCVKPYPWMTSVQTFIQAPGTPHEWPLTAVPFHWED